MVFTKILYMNTYILLVVHKNLPSTVFRYPYYYLFIPDVKKDLFENEDTSIEMSLVIKGRKTEN